MKYPLVLAILLLTIFSACREEAEPKVDKELESYFESFEVEAENQGLNVDLDNLDITATIEDIPDGSGETAGKCTRYSNNHRHVSIDQSMWQSSTELMREFIVYHELGHCVLNREHEDGQDETGHCLSIMHSGPGICIFNYNEMTRGAYLAELFK